MARILFRRFLYLFPILIGMSILTFLLSRVVPTDPARLIAGPRASAEALANIRHEYGLDLPLWQQYFRYIGNLAHLDFGKSFSSFHPVTQDLVQYLPATAELALSAFLLAVMGGIGIGLISAIWQDSFLDQISRFFAIFGISMPAFWLALLAQLLLYQRLGWLPNGGRISDEAMLPPTVTHFLLIDSLLAGQFTTFIDALRHLLLPALILALEPLGILARITRTSMIEVLQEQYIITARAKGLKEHMIIWVHALKNAMLPIVTMMGLLIGYLLGGSVLVETVFSWPGIGRYSARAITSSDYNAVMGVTLVIATIYIITNIIVDLVYAKLDPRIHYE